MPYQGQALNQTAWNQNVQQQQDFLPFVEDEELFTVNDTDVFAGDGPNNPQPDQISETPTRPQTIPKQKQLHPSLLPNQSPSPSQALRQPRVHNMTTGTPPTKSKSPTVNDSALRAAELRAKLLAKKNSAAVSAQGSPAPKPVELANVNPNGVQATPQRERRGRVSDPKALPASDSATAESTTEQQAGDQSTDTTNSGGLPAGHDVISTDIEGLFAEARQKADAENLPEATANGNHRTEISNQHLESDRGNDKKSDIGDKGKRPALTQKIPSSELSEGEIHSGSATPNDASAETEQALQETEEKQIRQNQVNKAYQTLEEPMPQNVENPKATVNNSPPKYGTKVMSKTAEGSKAKIATSPTSAPTPRAQPEKTIPGNKADNREQHPSQQEVRKESERERLREPTHRDTDKELRRPSASETYVRAYDRLSAKSKQDNDSYRWKLSDDNAKAAAEYKRNLGLRQAPTLSKDPEVLQTSNISPRQELVARRPQTSRPTDKRKESIPNANDEARKISENKSSIDERNTDNETISPSEQAVEVDDDFNDWLELTEYYDLPYREKRLNLFRRKKKLDAQRLELEREEQLEMQERFSSMRATSLVPTTMSPRVVRSASAASSKMPPPPLPLKESNIDVGVKIKDSALSAGLSNSQQSSPSLKRQHAEDDTETRRLQPAEKVARLDLNGYSSREKEMTSPASLKGESPSFKGDTLPLESRISKPRIDRWPAARSRSPVLRRRSVSPSRRYSGSYSPDKLLTQNRDVPVEKRFNRTCNNCGQHGHHVNQCTEPREGNNNHRTYHSSGQKGHYVNDFPEMRRDGREHYASTNAPISRGYEQWISPNYRGRNPIPRAKNQSPHIRAGGGDRSRYNSLSRIEDGETVGGSGRENIGSTASLNPGTGGQSRR